MAAQIHEKVDPGIKKQKPILTNKLEGCGDIVHMACFVPHEDAVITVAGDRTLRVWIKRDSGQYWPSIVHYMAAPCTALEYNGESRRIFVGMSNGTISEMNLTEDLNRLTPRRDYLAHMKTVKDVKFSLEFEWLISCGNDKYFQWHSTSTGNRLGGYSVASWCTCLQFDAESKYVFLGDLGGQINVLKLNDNNLTQVTTLKGHSGSIQCLTWDPEQKWLFSGSFDQSVIIWDIGGQQGTALELQGHAEIRSGNPFWYYFRNKVRGVCYASHAKKLFSAGDDEILVAWDMSVKRHETPDWSQSDACEKCLSPFFWNFKNMWEHKVVGVRQHHCRKCGRATCSKCSDKTSPLPLLGFEFDVRVCEECHASILEEETRPLAMFHDTKHSVNYMSLDLTKGRLLTCGKDKVVKLWDIKTFLLSSS